jgi:hypothetical protein
MFARLAALVLVTLGLGLAPPARAAWMWTGWEEFGGSQDECLRNAANVLQGINFTVTVNPQTTFGWRGQDGVSVRCIAERRIAVIFVHAATSSEEGRVILDQVRAAYKPGGSPAVPPATPPAPGRGGSKF